MTARLPLFVQISQHIPHIQAYISTQKRTRSYTEEYLHGTKWPIDRPTNTAADTATASAEASADAPDDALVDAPAQAAATNTASFTLLLRRRDHALKSPAPDTTDTTD